MFKNKVVGVHYVQQGSKIGVLSDCHIGSTNACMSFDTFKSLMDINKDPSKLIFDLGDNIDLKNIRHKELPTYRDRYESLRTIWRRHSVSGNHDGNQNTIGECIIVHVNNSSDSLIKTIVFTHFDNQSNSEHWYKYRGKSKGAGFFRRGIIVNLIEWAEYLGKRSPNGDFIENCVLTCSQLTADEIHGGHLHPQQEMVIAAGSDKKIVIHPRGYSEFTV